MGLTLKRIKEISPISFIETFYPNIYLWEKQKEILLAIKEKKKVVVPAGFGVGKTFTAALAVIWFLYTRPRSLVLTTAPTWRQVETILWREINKFFRLSKFPLGGEITLTRLKIDNDWWAMGLSTDEPERFQGYHAEDIFLVFDEAPGIKDEIWDIAEGIMVSEGAKWLAIGNPVSLYDKFGSAYLSPEWHQIKISCFDHPNVKLNKTIIKGAVTKEWIEERKREWGEDHPLYISRVLGDFPKEESGTFIPITLIEAAMEREVEIKESDEVIIGCDVARYGDDKTAIAVKKGMKVIELISYQGQNLMHTVGVLKQLYEKYGGVINIDDTGLGGGVTDRLRELNIPVNAFNFGDKKNVREKHKYYDLATELWGCLKELLKQGLISLPQNKELKLQLAQRRYEILSTGQIKLESKDELKKRGLKSPDLADAVALACYSAPKLEIRWV